MNTDLTPATDEEIRQYRAELDRRRARQYGGLAVVVVFAMLAVLARVSGVGLLGLPFGFWGTLAATMLIGKIIYLHLKWRCPRCNSVLGPTYNPRFCSNCGVELRSTVGA